MNCYECDGMLLEFMIVMCLLYDVFFVTESKSKILKNKKEYQQKKDVSILANVIYDVVIVVFMLLLRMFV